MEMDKLMGTLTTMLAEMQEKADANAKPMREDMKGNQEKADAARKADHEEMMAWLTDMRNDRKETMGCLERTEAHLEIEKPASEDRTPEVAHEQEVPLEDAVDMPVGVPRKRRWDRRNLAAVRRQKKKDQILDARRRGNEQKRAQKKMGAEETWSLPVEGRPVVDPGRDWSQPTEG
jgi:hypothetical protein